MTLLYSPLLFHGSISLYLTLLHSTTAQLDSTLLNHVSTAFYITLYYGSTILFHGSILHSTWLHSTLAHLHCNWLYITLPCHYFNLLHSTSLYCLLAWLYFTILDSTLLYHSCTSLFLTVATTFHHGSTSLYLILHYHVLVVRVVERTCCWLLSESPDASIFQQVRHAHVRSDFTESSPWRKYYIAVKNLLLIDLLIST